MSLGYVMPDSWGIREWPLKMWPACGKCSKDRQRRYVVEVFGFVGRERSRTNDGKFMLVLDVECHGAKDTIRLPIPYTWSDGKIMEMVARCICFNSRRNALGTEQDGRVGFLEHRSLHRTDWADLRRQTTKEILAKKR